MTFMTTIIFLCTLVLIGTLTSRLAKQKGRDPVMWFWFGVMFGLIAVLILYFLKEEKEPELASPKVEMDSSGIWFILDKETPLGPFSFEDIQKKFQEGTFTMSSYLWHEQWSDWKRASDVPDVASQLKLSPSE